MSKPIISDRVLFDNLFTPTYELRMPKDDAIQLIAYYREEIESHDLEIWADEIHDIKERLYDAESRLAPRPETGGDARFQFGFFPRAKYRDLVFYVEGDKGMNIQLFERPDTEENRAMIAALLASQGQGEAEDHEPGEIIAGGECPCCGASLEVTYGDDEGELAVVGRMGNGIVRETFWAEIKGSEV